jgi:hypothetical protein
MAIFYQDALHLHGVHHVSVECRQIVPLERNHFVSSSDDFHINITETKFNTKNLSFSCESRASSRKRIREKHKRVLV